MSNRILFAALTVLSALVLMGLTARAAEPPHIMMALEPWLDAAAELESSTEARAARLDAAGKEWRRLTLIEDGYAARLERFAFETETLSAQLRGEPAGEEPACILKGLALDLTIKAKALRDADDAETARGALIAIAQLLKEPRLIFAAETASLAGTLWLAESAAPCPNATPGTA